MEAAGALGVAAPILESIPNPPGGAGWSWVGCGCHKVPIYRPNSNSAEFRALFFLKLYQLKGWSAFCAADSVSLTMSSGGGMKRLMETDVVVFNHR